MDFELQQFKEVKKYLDRLGYPSESILFEYLHTDVSVVVENRVLVVVEVKRQIPTYLDEIAYNPIVRKLQKEAHELGAKYYLLSNGLDHIWMQTGENGRAEITIEVKYNAVDNKTLTENQFTKEILSHIVAYLRNFPITGDYLYDLSIVLYVKLIHEKNKNVDLTYHIEDMFGKLHLQEKLAYTHSLTSVLNSALDRLQDLDLSKNRVAVLSFIDDFLIKNRRDWNVPRWLADFMLKIFSLNPKDSIIDLFAWTGVLTSAAYLNSFTNVQSYYTNQSELYWIKIQQLLTLGRESNVRFEPSLLSGHSDFLMNENVDGIILAPPFGLKFKPSIDSFLSSIGIRDSTCLYLEAALNAVKRGGKVISIIPDGFLLSSQYVKARDYFLREAFIEAIIGLPPETFIPFSSVKTSILIIAKKQANDDSSTFFASIDEVPSGILMNAEQSSVLSETIRKFQLAQSGGAIQVSKNGFLVKDLDIDNFHFSNYWLKNKLLNNNSLEEGFMAIPLKELLVENRRGSALVADDLGDIPYIGPAAIRNLRIDKSQFTYTISSKLPSHTIKIRVGDVLINSIGPYRGNAAVISSEFEGMLINRHIFVLRPNTNLILSGYLAIALNSKFVKEQLLDKSTGTVISSLNSNSFEEIYLPVPNIERQDKIVREYLEILTELKSTQDRLSEISATLNLKLSQFGKGGNVL